MNRQNLILLACVFAAACNSKSPETTETPAEEPIQRSEANVAEVVEKVPEAPKALPRFDEPNFVAVDLLANRPNAHRLETGDVPTVVLDTSAADFMRYIHGNHPSDWSLDVDLDGTKAAILNKKRVGKIWAPGFKGATTLQLSVWSGSDNNSLTIKANGKDLPTAQLVKGWQIVSAVAEAGVLGAENTLELDFSNMTRINKLLSGGGVSWIRVGAPKEQPPTNTIPAAQGALSLKGGDGMFFMLWGLPKSALTFEMKAKAGCGINVSAEIEDGKGGTQNVLTQSVVALEGQSESQTSFISLESMVGQIGRVTLSSTPDCEVELSELSMRVPGVQPAVPAVAPPKHVVFWMSDTLRADHVPIHFETDVRAPNFKKLAEEGASFKLAYVEGNESKTSHASLFSGMYPNKHRVIGKGRLKPELKLLPEAIQDAGYRTAGFMGNGYVSEGWGFVQGWDTYKNELRDEGRFDGPSMAQTGVNWAAKNTDVPFFLYIGTVDPHVTYRSHEGIIEHYESEPYKGRFDKACYGEDLGKIKGGAIKVTDAEKERIHDLYKNEVEFNDMAFGQLRKGLEDLGLWKDTMVVIAADHGDEFWEHGGVGHGHSMYADQTHIPLIIYYPPLIPAGTVVEAGVDLMDVYPTIIEALGKARPDDLQGKSLVPLIHKVHADYPEPAVATQYLLHYGMQMQQWKLYLRRGEYQIYDRANDHSEQNDVSQAHPLASRWLLDAMGWTRGYRGVWDKEAFGPATNLTPDFLTKLSESVDRD